MKLFWNRIKKSRETGDTNYNNISLAELENHFKNKFSYDFENENCFIANARAQVEMKLSECQNVYNDFVFTVTNLRRFIKNLKNGCAPGGDSITSEHVKLAIMPFTTYVPVFFWPNSHNFRDIELKF